MSRNEPWSAITHLVGTILSIAGLVLLLVFAGKETTPWHIIAFSIFGASMILLYLASTLYHFFYRGKKVKEVFRRIDHAMIYVLIAGTYTPFCLTVLRGTWGWSILGTIWALAITGISLKGVGVHMAGWFSTMLYLVMGWLITIAIIPLTQGLPAGALWLLFGGGIFYSVGAVLFAIDERNPHYKTFGLHEYFHLCVIAGTLLHYLIMWFYIR